MTTKDLQEYEYVKRKASECGLELLVRGFEFVFCRVGGNCLDRFNTIEEASTWILIFEAGYLIGFQHGRDSKE